MFGEAIRTTILSLAQSNGGRFPNSVVVTSAHGGEGKSFVARSLAIELAATGQQVLLVDGDLRRGNLGSLFKPGSKQGLNEFLSGGASLGDIVHYHSRTGIAFIPRGDPGLDRRPDLAGMAEILEFARSNSLIAIFDSAPVLASTDTVQMTTLTERTVMVVQWAKTGRHAVEYALRSLKSVSSSNVLVAINKVRPGRHALYGFTDSELFSKSLKKYRDMTL
jgi:Mrp family chromosome partitioning ATPase